MLLSRLVVVCAFGFTVCSTGAHAQSYPTKPIRIKITHIPYKSGTQSVLDLLSGQVQLSFNTLEGLQDHLRTGRLRALAVGSAKPSALLPGVPTVAATLPGFESAVSLGMFAPVKTPRTIINRLNQEVVRILNTDEAKTRLLAIAVEPVASSPEGLSNAVTAEMNRVAKLVKDGAIKVD